MDNRPYNIENHWLQKAPVVLFVWYVENQHEELLSPSLKCRSETRLHKNAFRARVSAKVIRKFPLACLEWTVALESMERGENASTSKMWTRIPIHTSTPRNCGGKYVCTKNTSRIERRRCRSPPVKWLIVCYRQPKGQLHPKIHASGSSFTSNYFKYEALEQFLELIIISNASFA